MNDVRTCRHCGEEIYPSGGHWQNTGLNGRDPQFYCAALHDTFHEPVSDLAAVPPGLAGDIDESSPSSAQADRGVLARELVAGLRSSGEGCACAAWAAMECGCSEAKWPEHYVDAAADFIEENCDLSSEDRELRDCIREKDAEIERLTRRAETAEAAARLAAASPSAFEFAAIVAKQSLEIERLQARCQVATDMAGQSSCLTCRANAEEVGPRFPETVSELAETMVRIGRNEVKTVSRTPTCVECGAQNDGTRAFVSDDGTTWVCADGHKEVDNCWCSGCLEDGQCVVKDSVAQALYGASSRSAEG